jgi:hypothetical protein
MASVGSLGAGRVGPAGRDWFVVGGGEGGEIELHGAFGPGQVGAGTNAGRVEVPLADSTVPMAASTRRSRGAPTHARPLGARDAGQSPGPATTSAPAPAATPLGGHRFLGSSVVVTFDRAATITTSPRRSGKALPCTGFVAR